MSRFHLVEYGPPVALLPDLAAALGEGTAEAARVLSEAGNRVARQVGLKDAPIELSGGLVSSHSIAGLLRLGRSSELEISPKFLGSHADGTGWQQDFFFLAMLSKHGHLLTSDRIRSRPGESNDLDVLLARAIHDMYMEQQHRPIRSYQRTTEHDFFLDGDVDPFDLKMPDAGGYPQEVIRFNRATRQPPRAADVDIGQRDGGWEVGFCQKTTRPPRGRRLALCLCQRQHTIGVRPMGVGRIGRPLLQSLGHGTEFQSGQGVHGIGQHGAPSASWAWYRAPRALEDRGGAGLIVDCWLSSRRLSVVIRGERRSSAACAA